MKVRVQTSLRAAAAARCGTIALLGVIALLAGVGGAAALPAQAPARAEPAATRAVPTESRAFSHRRHMALQCTDCHASDREHGSVKVNAPGDCQACHHAANAKAGRCAACHAPGQMTRGVTKSVTFNVSARKSGPVKRDLVFTHALHGKFQCSDCHAKGVAKQVENSCNSCHADHHDAQRDCAACHPSARTGHDRAIHDGCTSCHTNRRVRLLSASRSTCVMCHAPQLKHYVGRECAECHAADWAHGAS